MNELEATLREAVSKAPDGAAFATRAAAGIRRFGRYRWVGIYNVGVEEIIALGWDGPAAPEHPRFPRFQGLCGAAAAEGKPLVVGDVRRDPRYLTTHTTTRSEIVVPIFGDEQVVGLIDVESDQVNAFDDQDMRLLEHCAGLIAPWWAPA